MSILDFVKKHLQTVLCLVILSMLIGVAQINNTIYVHSTITSKFIVFLYASILLLFICCIRIILSEKIKISISRLDSALFFLVLFIVLNRFIFHTYSSFSIRYIEFIGLVGIYLIVRTIAVKNYYWFLLAIVISGIIQAIYGNLQLLGYYSSNHSGFKMTGSFFNPGPYAGFLISTWAVALGMYLYKEVILEEIQEQFVVKFKPLKKVAKYIFEYIPLLGIVSVAIVIPATQSRAAWLAGLMSTIVLLEIRYGFLKRFLKNSSKTKKAFTIVVSVIVIGTGLFGVYQLKKGSSDGRLFIWKVTSEMIQETPFFGVGFDRFKVYYMNSQAAYFAENGETQEALVADNSLYAFNEVLQLIAENGFVGFLLFLIVVVVMYTTKVKSKNKTLFVIGKIALICIFVFACFSYPIQILPIKLIGVFLISLIAQLDAKKKTIVLFEKTKSVRFLFKTMLFVVSVSLAYNGFEFVKRMGLSFENWKKAMTSYRYGDYNGAIVIYKKEYLNLKKEGTFLMNYGKTLSMNKEYKAAVEILEEAKIHLNTTIIETSLGDSYKGLKNHKKAEQAYQHAAEMIPVRFYPHYLLAKLYQESGQRNKAEAKAKELLNKEIKIPSPAIREIKAEMKQLLDKK